jgi:hypothetical protein
MNVKKIVAPVVGLALIALGWRAGGWGGVAFAVGGIVMYLLIQFNRMMAVMRRAARRPKGHVGSAVMLNAKLKPGVSLLHVMAMTDSIGEPLSAPDEQPEIFRWTDGTDSSVTCEFTDGKLVKWDLHRPEAPGP